LQNEYTKSGSVVDYKDWQVPLGRRFRALKLWFVMRSFGLNGLKQHLRHKVRNAQRFEQYILQNSDTFELFTQRTLSLVCFRVKLDSKSKGSFNSFDLQIAAENKLNSKLLDTLNATGKMFLISTELDKRTVLRLACGGVDQPLSAVDQTWKLIQSTAVHLLSASQ
jgi:glutamate/tyrosine decarboxylase-like PLP-dependent enzyme